MTKYPLKTFSSYNNIFIDVDDTLIKTTLTLDSFSKYPVLFSKHPLDGRWQDFEDVVINYDNALLVPLYEGVNELFELLKDNNVTIISAAPKSGESRNNRINSLGKYGSLIKFFDNDTTKRKYLERHVTKKDLIIDDKESILYNMKCDTLLINSDVNSNGISILNLVEYWRNNI